MHDVKHVIGGAALNIILKYEVGGLSSAQFGEESFPISSIEASSKRT
jgi:hypothetical protein